MKTNKPINDFTILFIDNEIAYMKDGDGNYYCLDFYYKEKSLFRDYACVEPEHIYIDEDGDICKEYDDDTWELNSDVIGLYIKEYDKLDVYNDFVSIPDNDCGIFRVFKEDEWWYGLPVSERLDELDDIEIDGVCHNDYPKYTDAYISNATIFDGFNQRELTQEELELVNEDYDFVYKKVMDYLF